MNIMGGFIFILLGVFFFAASQSDWEWYWNHHRTRMWVSLFGEDGARKALSIFSIVTIIVGIIFIFIRW